MTQKKSTSSKASPSSSAQSSADDNQTPFDPLAFSKQMGEILERLQPLFVNYAQKHGGGDDLAEQGFSIAGMQNVLMDYWQNALQNPQKLLDINLEYAQNMFLLWQESTRKFLGEDSEQIVQTEKGDRRFKDPIWQDSFVFDFIRQSYLLTSQWLQKSVRDADTLPERERKKLDFYTRLFVDALAPTNFAMTNGLTFTTYCDSIVVIQTAGETAKENKMSNPKQQLIDEVAKLVKTDPAPHNETTLEDWILEGDTDDMSAQEIADEWDEVNSQEQE